MLIIGVCRFIFDNTFISVGIYSGINSTEVNMLYQHKYTGMQIIDVRTLLTEGKETIFNEDSLYSPLD